MRNGEKSDGEALAEGRRGRRHRLALRNLGDELGVDDAVAFIEHDDGAGALGQPAGRRQW